MHVMAATDGSLDAKKTARIAANLSGPDGRVTVFTAVEVPREMINAMRAAASEPVGTAPDVDVQFRRTQAGDGTASQWAGDDAVVARYVRNAVEARTADLVAELVEIGVEHSVESVESENAARSVLQAIVQHNIDIICIGTHGLGRFEGLMGSMSTKVSRLAPCSVVLVR